MVYVFLPDDLAAHELPRAQEFARGIHARGEARMPGLEQGAPAARRLIGQQRNLPRGGRRRLFQHHVFARAQRGERRVEMRLRRRADGNAMQIGDRGQHGLEVRKVRDSVHRRIAACAGRQLEARVRAQRRNVLIARDLADA